MMYCFILSQVIFMRGFLVALNSSANAADGNTNKTDFSVVAAKARPLKWAVGLLVTELVSVLLIAWSLSILYRLACS